MTKLQKQIKNKLEKLQTLLDKCDEARVIDPDDSDTWDADTLADLAEQLKEASALSEDLISLLEEYHEENNEDYE